MTATLQDQSASQGVHEERLSRAVVRDVVAAVAIVTMWVAVLFVGIYGGEATFHGVDTSVTTVPSGIFVALFAAIGTASIAKRVFGSKAD